VRNVVDKFVKDLAAQLADRRVSIEVDELARDWLAEKGYEPLFGARPLARVIQEKIKRPLADELLFGRLVKGGKVVVTILDGEPSFQITPTGGGPALLPKPSAASDGDDDEEEEDDQLVVDA
jgi:ATP-dependent Clp protease ATP-binding subunit ClpA